MGIFFGVVAGMIVGAVVGFKFSSNILAFMNRITHPDT